MAADVNRHGSAECKAVPDAGIGSRVKIWSIHRATRPWSDGHGMSLLRPVVGNTKQLMSACNVSGITLFPSVICKGIAIACLMHLRLLERT